MQLAGCPYYDGPNMIAQLVVEKNRNPVRVFLLNKQILNTGEVLRLTATSTS